MVRMLTSKFGDLDADVRYGVEHATTEQIAVLESPVGSRSRVGRGDRRPEKCLLVVTDLP